MCIESHVQSEHRQLINERQSHIPHRVTADWMTTEIRSKQSLPSDFMKITNSDVTFCIHWKLEITNMKICTVSSYLQLDGAKTIFENIFFTVLKQK